MPYAGKDWSKLSAKTVTVLGIDLGPYLIPGDSLIASSLTATLTLTANGASASQYLNGAPYLLGTVANQSIQRPETGGYYKLCFVCNTLNGNVIELWSNFGSQ